MLRIDMKSSFNVLIVTLFPLALFAQATHKPLVAGDEEYDKANYKNAEKYYRTAADYEHSNPKALYNLGNALYQQGKWEDAAQRFEQSARLSADKESSANAQYNLGNALMQQHKFQDAVDAYQKGLRLNPGDADARKNLQMAKKKLQEEQQKEKENQQKNQQQQDQSNQDQQQKDQDQQKDQQEQQNQQDPQDQQPQNQPSQQQPEEQKQLEEKAKKLKKEEAKRLLETAVDPEDQQNARKYRSAKRQSGSKANGKDW